MENLGRIGTKDNFEGEVEDRASAGEVTTSMTGLFFYDAQRGLKLCSDKSSDKSSDCRSLN